MDTNFGAGELIFIDTGISNYQSLIPEIAPDNQVFYIDSTQNGFQQISDVLDDYTNIDALHIYSHGAEGSLDLGNITLNQNSLSQHENELTAWKNSLTDDADILFYGCNVASENGDNFLLDIANLTQADIAASDDLTGNSALNGDWDLEHQQGLIETQILSSANFNSLLLTTITDTSTTDFNDDVTVGSNLTIDGDVTLQIDGDFTLGSSYKITGNGDNTADNLTIKATGDVTISGDLTGLGNVEIQAGVLDSSDFFNFPFTSNAGSDVLSLVNEATVTIGSDITTSGKITLDSPQIKLSGSANLDADGDISLKAEDIRLRTGLSPWGYSDKEVSITIEDGAKLEGSNVTINATVEDDVPWSEAPKFVQKLAISPF